MTDKPPPGETPEAQAPVDDAAATGGAPPTGSAGETSASPAAADAAGTADAADPDTTRPPPGVMPPPSSPEAPAEGALAGTAESSAPSSAAPGAPSSAPSPAAATAPPVAAPSPAVPPALRASPSVPPSRPPPLGVPPGPSRRDPYFYGNVEDVGWFTRFLWFCAGADAQLLVRCPNSDRVKFQGIGGVVLTVGVLAFLSGSYAFYTVFSPKDVTALGEGAVHVPSVVISGVFGLVWALIIFNIDRFIVSSTGKGDGTEKITWGEFSNAIPRLIMALIIGMCLSKPLEIRILQSEIESQLEKEQKDYLKDLNAKTEALSAKERTALREKIDSLQARMDETAATLEKRRVEIKEQRRLLELEAEGKTGSGKAGRGPAYRDKKANLDALEEELERDRATLLKRNQTVEDELNEAKTTLASLDDHLAEDKKSNAAVARHVDGLMKRIQISHEIGGWIPFAIMLLLLCIEAGPIFFKLMIIKGAYDYLEENQKRLVRAQAGVEPDAKVVADKKGKNILIDIHHAVNAILDEEKRRLETEQLLAEEVHEAYRQRMKEKIQEDPSRFVEG